MDTVPYRERAIIIPIYNVTLLPGVSTMIYFAKPPKHLEDEITKKDTLFVLAPIRRDATREDISSEDFYRYGVSFYNGQLATNEKGTFLSAKLMNRLRLEDLHQENGQWYGETMRDQEQADLDEQGELQILTYIKQSVKEVVSRFKNGDVYIKMMDNVQDLNTMIAYLSQFLPLSAQEKYELLESESQKKRGLYFMDLLLKQKETFELNLELREKIADKTNRAYRKQILQEQMKAIQEELKDDQERGDEEEEDYKSRILQANLPKEVEKAALKEAKKLDTMGMGNAEENVIRNYLDFLLSLPWTRSRNEEIDLRRSKKILDSQHFGLQQVKKRILQHLAVLKLREGKKGSILLLVGPPGTGKTSLGKSIAQALDRPYVRISLGGIHDEAEIRGHRRTYIGALPGNILKCMQKAGKTNPLIVLDEVDKVQGRGYNGDPSSALLEVLDPEQNNTFMDHYLDLPYDLSDVFFIATANTLDTIPQPLLDRMEVITISGYTDEEKFHIGKEHLASQVLEENGLDRSKVSFTDGAMKGIIEQYTREAGVRGLKKQLSAVVRTLAQKIVNEEITLPYTVKKRDLEELLGPPVARHDRAGKENPPGVVTGLAWTPLGGEILFIEALAMPGKGGVKLTGQLGDVMQESAQISLSLLRSYLPFDTAYFQEHDLHIHVPSGAVSKDGPSAGIALFSALASMATGIKVDPHLAMTGEITLRGKVLPIGGLKEKLLAARQAGITEVLIPKDNVNDLKEFSEELKDALNIIPVETAEDVLTHALKISLKQLACTFQSMHPSFPSSPLKRENEHSSSHVSIL